MPKIKINTTKTKNQEWLNMCKIKLNTNLVFNDSVNTLKEDFDKIVKPKLEMTNFTNTESSLIKIIQESLDYFDSLDSNFLGKESTSCTPNMETDHFANTFYRLSNSLDYIYKLLPIKRFVQQTK